MIKLGGADSGKTFLILIPTLKSDGEKYWLHISDLSASFDKSTPFLTIRGREKCIYKYEIKLKVLSMKHNWIYTSVYIFSIIFHTNYKWL